MKSNFRDWNLEKVEETFGLKMVGRLPVLDDLMAFQYQMNDNERWVLEQFREVYLLGGNDWNEVELENKIISPLFVIARIDNEKFAYFLERPLAATLGEHEISGNVDGMIATGFRSPKKPYFCMNEYKRATDPNGDPRGQALIAMLAAQQLNDNRLPIFGSYIIGRHWSFIALVGKQFAFSNSLACDDDEIFEIYRILKGLYTKIEALIA